MEDEEALIPVTSCLDCSISAAIGSCAVSYRSIDSYRHWSILFIAELYLRRILDFASILSHLAQFLDKSVRSS